MLVFLTVEKGDELPKQHAIFIGPYDFILAKAKDVQSQCEVFLQEGGGRDGDICVFQLPSVAEKNDK